MAVDHDQNFEIGSVLATAPTISKRSRTTLIPGMGSIPRPRLRTSPKRSSSSSAGQVRSRAPVREAKVKVFITYESSAQAGNAYNLLGIESPTADPTIQADMTISTWTYEYQRYFTILLSQPTGPFPSPRSRRPAPPKPSNLTPEERIPPGCVELPVSINQRHCPHCGYDIVSASLPPSGLACPSPYISSLRLSGEAVEHNDFSLKQLLRMKDAMLDATDIPIIAMWGDGSLAVHNKALARLLIIDGDPVSDDASDILSRIRVYTEDFDRELELYEYPIVRLCRERKSIPGNRFGLVDSKHCRRVFECVGGAIYNDRTGEFQAGVSAWKEVTWYLDLIKAQSEQHEKQFQLICERIPQMVS